jgi:hypothetical protein
MMLTALLGLLLGLASAPAQDPGTATLRGQVRSESTGAPLPAALIELRAAAASRSVVSDVEGRYVMRGVPAGRRVLRATHIGYEALEVEVQVGAGAEMTIDLALRLRPVPLSGITVRGRADALVRDTAEAPPPALGLAGTRVLEAAPGIVDLGLGDGPRGSPGQAPVDPSDVLFVRGVPSDLKLVLLDGAPVYTPFHIGGLLESFDAHVLREATLYLGGAPARYDGGLSYILDLSTRAGRGDRVHSSGAVDMMSARANVEGGVGQHLRYLFGGRGVHGFGVDPMLRGSLPYAYHEALGRTDLSLGDAGKVSLSGFRNQESVSLDSLGLGRQAGWGNTALSLRFLGALGGTDTEITAAYGGSEAELPALGQRSFPARADNERLRLTADFGRSLGPVRLRYGASFDHLRLRHQVRSRAGDPLPRTWDGEAAGPTTGAYLESGWQPSPRLRLRGGLRGDVFFADPGLRLAPRLSATWMLSERAALTAAAGRYHQYVRTTREPLQLLPQDSPDTLFLVTGFAVDQATHFNLALHQELDEGIRLGVEGFFKTFAGSHAAEADRTQASGLDLWVRRDVGRYRGWLGYSLSWVWSTPALQTASEQFAGRQLVNLGVLAPVANWADVQLRLVYGAGLPFSAIPMDSPVGTPNLGTGTPAQLRSEFAGSGPTYGLAQSPSDPYLRLDLEVSHTFVTRWRGAPLEIAPYVKVLNSLDRRDAIFYWYDRNSGGTPQPISALPVLPIMGVSWKF